MSDQEARREVLKTSLERFLDICDATENMVAGTSAPRKAYDVSDLVDTLIPVPIDFDSPENCTFRQLKFLLKDCSRCKLHRTRHHIVFGEGTVPARLMIIGEGPGADEDATGRPFVGRGGKYLDAWLKAIGMSRDKDVFIGNIVKCRPPQNRVPEIDEITTCLPFLKRQIQLVKPEVLLLLGGTASRTLLETGDGVGRMRGTFHRYEGIPTLVTYHPAGVLRNPSFRRPVWEDMKKIASFLNIPIPGRS